MLKTEESIGKFEILTTLHPNKFDNNQPFSGLFCI